MAASGATDDVWRDEEPIRLLKSYLTLAEATDRALFIKELGRLTKDPSRTFLQSPSVVYNFYIKQNRHAQIVEGLYKLDGRLRPTYHRLVPARVKSHLFWTNYLSRLFLLVQQFLHEYEDQKQNIIDEFNEMAEKMRMAKVKDRLDVAAIEQPTTLHELSKATSPVKTLLNKAEMLRVRQRDAIQGALQQAIRFSRIHLKDSSSAHFVTQQENNTETSWIEYALQALLVFELSRSGLYYPTIAKNDAIVLNQHSAVKEQVVNSLRSFYAEELETQQKDNELDNEAVNSCFSVEKDPMSERHIMSLIGYASHDDMTDYVWILDSVDSTKNLLKLWKSSSFTGEKTIPLYSCQISIALVKDGHVMLAGLGIPHTKFKRNNHLEGRLIYSEKTDKEENAVHVYNIVEEEKGDEQCTMGRAREAKFDSTCAYTKLLQFCKSSELPRNAGSAAGLLMQLSGIEQESLKFGYAGMLLPMEEKETNVELEKKEEDDGDENFSPEDYFQIKTSNLTIRTFCTPDYVEISSERHSSRSVYRHAAASFIIQQAGGRVTDLHGRPLCFNSGRILRNVRAVVATAMQPDAHLRFCKALASVIDPSPVSFQVSIQGSIFVDEKMVRRAIADALELELDQVTAVENVKVQ